MIIDTYNWKWICWRFKGTCNSELRHRASTCSLCWRKLRRHLGSRIWGLQDWKLPKFNYLNWSPKSQMSVSAMHFQVWKKSAIRTLCKWIHPNLLIVQQRVVWHHLKDHKRIKIWLISTEVWEHTVAAYHSAGSRCIRIPGLKPLNLHGAIWTTRRRFPHPF